MPVFLYNELQANQTFALEIKLSLSFKADCYTNILGKLTQRERLSGTLFTRCAELREIHRELFSTKVILDLSQHLQNNEEKPSPKLFLK